MRRGSSAGGPRARGRPRPAATGATTGGKSAGSSDASASQNATSSEVRNGQTGRARGAESPARLVDHGPHGGPSDVGRAVGRPVVDDDRPVARRDAGEHPRAERRPRRGPGTRRRPRLGARSTGDQRAGRALTGWEQAARPARGGRGDRTVRRWAHEPLAARRPPRGPRGRPLAVVGGRCWWRPRRRGRPRGGGRGVGLRAAPFAGRAGLAARPPGSPSLLGGRARGRAGPPWPAAARWRVVPGAPVERRRRWRSPCRRRRHGWCRVTAPLTTRHRVRAVRRRDHRVGSFVDGFTEPAPALPSTSRAHPPRPRSSRGPRPCRAGWGRLVAALALAGWGVAVAAALVAARSVAGEPAARRAAPALALLPGAVWAGTSPTPCSAAAARRRLALAVLGRAARARAGRGPLARRGVLLSPSWRAGAGREPTVVRPAGRRLDAWTAWWPSAAGAVLGPWAAAAGFWWPAGLAAARHAYWAGVASRPTGRLPRPRSATRPPGARHRAGGGSPASPSRWATRRWRGVLGPLGGPPGSAGGRPLAAVARRDRAHLAAVRAAGGAAAPGHRRGSPPSWPSPCSRPWTPPGEPVVTRPADRALAASPSSAGRASTSSVASAGPRGGRVPRGAVTLQVTAGGGPPVAFLTAPRRRPPRSRRTPSTTVANLWALRRPRRAGPSLAALRLRLAPARGRAPAPSSCPTSFIDRTQGRADTFHDTFDDGPAHAAFADPYDDGARRARC